MKPRKVSIERLKKNLSRDSLALMRAAALIRRYDQSLARRVCDLALVLEGAAR